MRTNDGAALAAVTLCVAAAAAGADDTEKEWRQLYETTGLTWNEVAAVCPQDGATPCAGTAGGRDLSRWVWATAEQVVAFMGETEPALLTADPPSLFGEEWFFSGVAFLDVMRYTYYFTTEIDYYAWTLGLTASLDPGGLAIGGTASYGYYPIAGGLGVGPLAEVDEADPYVGVWLWRPVGPDYTPPEVTPQLAGEPGDDGWYVSDVAVSFDVQDADSEITSRVGCDPVTVATDTTDTSFTCEATSEGGVASATATVKRDATAPALTCVTPVPVFTLGQLGAQVFANVADAMSGPRVTPVGAPAATNAAGTFVTSVTGRDRAGNARTRSCPYRVVVPRCGGLVPTIVGTGNPDSITGTSARDVIVGLDGSDTIDGGGGNDVICGGEGNDLVFGGNGGDRIYGEGGNDDLNGGNGPDNLDGGAGSDSIRGDDGDDRCTSGEVRMSSCTPY
jgi:Ca2+-binding RTX toxin-like protein